MGGGKCKAKLDIQILLDPSGSVPLKDFKNILKLLADKFVPEFDIGPDGTHVAVTSFGGDKPGVVRADIRLGQHKTAAALKKAIKAIKKINRLTPTQKALKNSLKSFLRRTELMRTMYSLFSPTETPPSGPNFLGPRQGPGQPWRLCMLLALDRASRGAFWMCWQMAKRITCIWCK